MKSRQRYFIGKIFSVCFCMWKNKLVGTHEMLFCLVGSFFSLEMCCAKESSHWSEYAGAKAAERCMMLLQSAKIERNLGTLLIFLCKENIMKLGNGSFPMTRGEKDMDNIEIAYQNKDITSKVLAEHFKGKTFRVYGLNVLPSGRHCRPTYRQLRQTSSGWITFLNLQTAHWHW